MQISFSMDFKSYLTKEYLFQINHVIIARGDKVFAAIGAILIVLAVLFKLAAVFAPTPVDKKYRQKFFNLFLSIGIYEVIWFGARAQTVTFFGSHFVALLGLLIGLVWLIILIVKMIKNYGREKQGFEKEQVKLKYLPK